MIGGSASRQHNIVTLTAVRNARRHASSFTFPPNLFCCLLCHPVIFILVMMTSAEGCFSEFGPDLTRSVSANTARELLEARPSYMTDDGSLLVKVMDCTTLRRSWSGFVLRQMRILYMS